VFKICKHDNSPSPVVKRNSNCLFRYVRVDFSKERFTLKTSYGFTVGGQMSLHLRS